MIAFSKASLVNISLAVIPFSIKFNTASEDFLVYSSKTFELPGNNAAPGKVKPNASAKVCIVAAVPINEQAPHPGQAFSL
ncbi:hypothetical protein D3C73_889750 [compost metagenome]